jgi:hypothetical protein
MSIDPDAVRCDREGERSCASKERRMKFMIIVKATADSEAGKMPSDAAMTAMGQFNEQLVNAGVLIAAEGLQESRKGARVRYAKGQFAVTDGPFSEAKELIAGFWIIDVKSRDEAIAWVKKIPFDEGEEIEIRKVWEASDWEEAGAPAEALAQEAELRARVEGK